MEELEKTARELILAITEKMLKSLNDKGLLKEPSKLQMLCSTPEMKSLIKKLSATKYAPRREFRKGDKVRLMQCNGRNPFDSFNGIEYPPDETIYTVEGDEYDNGKVELYAMDSCDAFEIHHSNIELVTPVEELEPYSVRESDAFDIVREGKIVMTIPFTEDDYYTFEQAKSAAEAECARLNAEYRKEMEK